MINMVDRLGDEVKVGDDVLFIPNHYKELYRGTISHISKARVRISHNLQSYVKSSNQFVKVNKFEL